jgi:hypothetical protein
LPVVDPTTDQPAGGPPDGGVDLDAVAAELADVERAMERIEAGTYWTDEVTGAPLDEGLLGIDPTARRNAVGGASHAAGGAVPDETPAVPPAP